MKKLAIILGLGVVLGTGAATASEITLPEYTKEDTTVKVHKGDLEIGGIQINGAIIAFPIAYIGDKNKDGKFDWESVMDLVDRNNDSSYDLVKVISTCDGKKFGEKGMVKGIVAWVDDDFDGYADRVLSDYKDEEGKNRPDGIWDSEDKATEGKNEFLNMNNIAKPKFMFMDVVEE